MITTKRPVSVSVISWILIAIAAFTLISLPFTYNKPSTEQMLQVVGASLGAVVVLNILMVLIYAAAGIGMLRQAKWGRDLYVYANPILLGLTFSLYHFKLMGFFVIGLGLYAALVAMLNRQGANDYFNHVLQESPVPDGETEPSLDRNQHWVKRTASVIILIPGGIFLMSWLGAISLLYTSLTTFLTTSAFMLFLASVFIVPAVFLWGRKRWSVLLGVLLSSVGGLLLLSGLMFMLMLSMPELKQQFARVDEATLDQLMHGWLIAGLGSGVLGSLFILLQRQLDKEGRPMTAEA